MINPINHTRTHLELEQYKREPYAVCGDVSDGKHAGRGGWSWYTGASSWLYKTAVEDVLGIKKEGNTLVFQPCVPSEWETYEIEYRYAEAMYRITVYNPQHVHGGIRSLTLDGKPVTRVELSDSGEHRVKLIIGQKEHI